MSEQKDIFGNSQWFLDFPDDSDDDDEEDIDENEIKRAKFQKFLKRFGVVTETTVMECEMKRVFETYRTGEKTEDKILPSLWRKTQRTEQIGSIKEQMLKNNEYVPPDTSDNDELMKAWKTYLQETQKFATDQFNEKHLGYVPKPESGEIYKLATTTDEANEDQHTWAANAAWMLSHIHQGKSFIIGSDVTEENYSRTTAKHKGKPSGFSREIAVLRHLDYQFEVLQINSKSHIVLTPQPNKKKTCKQINFENVMLDPKQSRLLYMAACKSPDYARARTTLADRLKTGDDQKKDDTKTKKNDSDKTNNQGSPPANSSTSSSPSNSSFSTLSKKDTKILTKTFTELLGAFENSVAQLRQCADLKKTDLAKFIFEKFGHVEENKILIATEALINYLDSV